MLLKRQGGNRRNARFAALLALASLMGAAAQCAAFAQSIDCNRLAAQISAAGRGDSGARYQAAAQKQRAELGRTAAYARQLGCDRAQFLFFGPQRPPQCDGLNARIAQMQSNLSGLENAAYGGGGREALQQRFDTYCRNAGGYQRSQNFFERLFDTQHQDRFGEEPPPQRAMPDPDAPTGEDADRDDNAGPARGGSLAVCVRSCDGGWFPVSYAARRRNLSELQDLCTALCPNTEAKLYTRAPNAGMGDAVAADGAAYSDMANAFKFEKAFDKTCTCKPPDKTWVEALAAAEQLMGETPKGDIVVTPEKSAELSLPSSASPAASLPTSRKQQRKFDAAAAAKALGLKTPPPSAGAAANLLDQEKKSADEATASDAAAAASAPTASGDSTRISADDGGKARIVSGQEGVKQDTTGPDGAKRKVRVIAPML